MITIVYQGIVWLILGLVIWNMFLQEDWKEQVASAIAIIPLILCVLGVKI